MPLSWQHPGVPRCGVPARGLLSQGHVLVGAGHECAWAAAPGIQVTVSGTAHGHLGVRKSPSRQLSPASQLVLRVRPHARRRGPGRAWPTCCPGSHLLGCRQPPALASPAHVSQRCGQCCAPPWGGMVLCGDQGKLASAQLSHWPQWPHIFHSLPGPWRCPVHSSPRLGCPMSLVTLRSSKCVPSLQGNADFSVNIGGKGAWS